MTIPHNDHHLLLGQTRDYLTGEIIADTHDERYRQKIARLLVESLGFEKSGIKKNIDLVVDIGTKRSRIKIDFLVLSADAGNRERIAMMIKYSPGSLVTRRQTCVALSRIIAPYQIPVAVITNGEDAEVMDGATGMVIATGLGSLPDRAGLDARAAACHFTDIPEKTRDLASRIVHACEIDGACPCDSDICRISAD